MLRWKTFFEVGRRPDKTEREASIPRQRSGGLCTLSDTRRASVRHSISTKSAQEEIRAKVERRVRVSRCYGILEWKQGVVSVSRTRKVIPRTTGRKASMAVAFLETRYIKVLWNDDLMARRPNYDVPIFRRKKYKDRDSELLSGLYPIARASGQVSLIRIHNDRSVSDLTCPWDPR